MIDVVGSGVVDVVEGWVMAAPRAVPIVLDEAVRRRLVTLAAGQTTQVRTVRRARIVLAAAAGATNRAIAAALDVDEATVRTWRDRFAAAGLAGLQDAPRSGRPRRLAALDRVAVIAAATSRPPGPEALWSHQLHRRPARRRRDPDLGVAGRTDPRRR